MISQNIHENFNLKSNLEIQIYFEFEQKIYETINEMFLIMGKKNIKIKQNDNSKANKGLYQHIKAIPTSLLNACIEKLNINNLANNNNNILIINYNILHDSIFLRGNYNKYTREIGQSPWEINGVKVCPSSVEEEMEKIILNYFVSNKLTMSAGGREDKDVRMLGNGRPFILEIFNPKNNIKNIKNLENEINKNSKYIKVNDLDKCEREYTEVIKQAELNKMKLYTSVIWVEKKINNSDLNIINNINNLKIIQKTPLRVLHRRTLTDREKIIHKMECKKINDHFLILDILASAGTYIKEFIHSDLGRTEPNLKSLLKSKCDILQLDVKELTLINK
jgi:tRNA pseudouridine synthase 10